MTPRRLEDGREIECCASCPHETWSLEGPGDGSVHGRCEQTGRWLKEPDLHINSQCPLRGEEDKS